MTETLTPVLSSGLQRDRAGDRLDSMSLPVKSSSDSSKDEAEDRPMEDELDSFLGDLIRAGDPPQPLSDGDSSSSGCRSDSEGRVGLGSLVMMSLGIVPG